MELKTPHILVPITRQQAEDNLIPNDSMCLQELINGDLLLIRYAGSEVTALDKINDPVELPSGVANALATLSQGKSIALIGVLRGQRFYAFDAVEFHGLDMRILQFGDRFKTLVRIIGTHRQSEIVTVQTYFGKEKKHWFDKLEQRAKGAVFKYTVGILAKDPQPPMFKVVFDRPDAKVIDLFQNRRKA